MANHLVDLPLAREPAEFAHEVVTVRSVSEFRALRQMWLALTRDAEDASLCDSYEYCELAASIAMRKVRRSTSSLSAQAPASMHCGRLRSSVADCCVSPGG